VNVTNLTVSGVASVTPDLRVPGAPPLLLVLAALLICVACLQAEPLARALSARERRAASALPEMPGHSGFARRWRVPALSCALLLVIGMVVAHPFAARVDSGSMEITFLDVGQGDSSLLLTPTGRSMLVDTGGLGGFSSESRLDTGEDVVAPYLWSRGIRRLDVLVLTHMDFDHAGGAPTIIRIFRPSLIWVPVRPKDHPLWEKIAASAAEAGAHVELRFTGELLDFHGVTIRVHHPSVSRKSARASNEVSLVMECRYGARTALFTGDLDRSGEQELLVAGGLKNIDLLKVAHHGSRTSTTDAFLDFARPRVAMISAGWLNPYRHPHPDVLSRLRARHAAVFRTDLDGAIRFRTDGAHWIVSSER